MVVVKPLTVHWHQDSAPIYSACFQPEVADIGAPPQRSQRLATAGGDNNVRLWRLRFGATIDETPGVEYLATLSKHERAVNAVAFDGSGRVLASAGDDGVVCLWTLSDAGNAPSAPFGSEFEDVETWKMVRKCRSASFGEIYDLAWSPSSRFLAATSMDKVVSILDATDGTCVAALRDHRHYVQGVAWDPNGRYLATQSSDQRVIVYALREERSGKLTIDAPVARLEKTELPGGRQSSFHPESFSSFFRRLSFSPDGALLVAPAAQIDTLSKREPEANTEASVSVLTPSPTTATPSAKAPKDLTADTTASTPLSTQTNVSSEGPQNCALLYARGDLRRPVGVVPLPKQSIAVRFCPVLFTLRSGESARIALPYRMVYAIATLSGVFIYDTEDGAPICMASNLHYSSLTDLAWSPDGRLLLLTSIDGFCSVVQFDKGELGEVWKGAEVKDAKELDTNLPSSFRSADDAKAPALSTAVDTVGELQPKVNILSVRKKDRSVQKPSAQPKLNSSAASAAPVPESAGGLSESSAGAA